MIVTIFKFLAFSLSWFFVFKQLKKNNYRGLFDNLSLQLLTLPFNYLWDFFSELIFNRLTENSILNKIALPLGLDWKSLCDTNIKKIFLILIVIVISLYRWFTILKKILLWPFKLGILSFIYSIIGFDMSWFLNLFNIFSFNIPNWVYVQYLTLYNNWLAWWYNTVNIKSITSVPIKEIKKIKNNLDIKPDHIETVKSDHSRIWYVVGGIIIVGGIFFALWYFDIFNNTDPGNKPGSDTPQNTIVSSSSTNNIEMTRIGDSQSSNAASSSSSVPSSQIASSSSSASSSLPNDPVSLMNREMGEFNRTYPHSRSSNSNNHLINSTSSKLNPFYNKFSPLSDLIESSRPDSPTGSVDSSETIKPSTLDKGKGKLFGDHIGRS